MPVAFAYPEDCLIDNPMMLEIDLSRFLAINRKSGHFVSPACQDTYFLETAEHYDRKLREGAPIPMPELNLDKKAAHDDPDYLGVLDGRKRLAWLALQGEKTAPVLVPKDNFEDIKRLIGAKSRSFGTNSLSI